MTPVEYRVARLKETGQDMKTYEKILYLRMTTGLGLCEAVDKLKLAGNYFDGPWREVK